MQNKKKILTLAIAGVLAIGAIGAGTLAFFTDSKTAENIITMGDIKVELTEPGYQGDSNGEIKNIMPNQTFTKDPTITMEADSNDAYVRANINIGATKDGAAFTLTAAEIAELFTNINIDTNAWYVDASNATTGAYVVYYKTSLKAGETVKVFTEVKIPSDWGNKFANVSINLDVKAEAIQADHFEPTITNGMITGWGSVSVE